MRSLSEVRRFSKVGLNVKVTTSTEIEIHMSSDMAEVLANHLGKALEAYRNVLDDTETCADLADLENLLETLDESIRS